jgi:molecular chaperone HscB
VIVADALKPIPGDADPFAVLGLDRRLVLDPRELDRALLRLSRENHPDRFAGADPEVLAVAQHNSARVNDAVRTLGDPVSRAECLLALEEVERPEGEEKCPPDLLLEVFELREELAESPSPGLATRAAGLLAAADRALAELFAAFDAEEATAPRRELLGRIREALDRRKFLAGLDREVRQVLG